ncbi:MAG: DUF1207 domain-containing protein [Planctomycetota bacterium]
MRRRADNKLGNPVARRTRFQDGQITCVEEAGMPRRNARVVPAWWGGWAPSCVHCWALLLCLISLGRVLADEFPRRLPPVTDVALAGHVLLADSTSPIHCKPSSQPAPVFDPSHDGSRDVPPAELLTNYMPLRPTDDCWTLQVMPAGLLYGSYMAGAKEPRFASYWSHDKNLGNIWDTALGGRLGLLRYGTRGVDHPEGFQVDIEGGTQARLDPTSESTMLLSADFRAGIPITYAKGRWQFKTGYYHVSSHLGDEYLLLFPDARRLDYSRDAILLGAGYFWTERLRLYAETARAIRPQGGAEPWEFLFGADWAPAHDTGVLGAPFAAVNVHLRDEVDFGGNFVFQAGWAWRRCPRGSCYRIGFEYFNGKSDQYEYYDRTEERLGWGMWIDF